ncbi:hypothetical protein WJX84_012064 [Apatococcus fuscideae]|uniref:K Homology domain-containing protein n=1 Tax=Apatococcus fuscideae TaxID=2026836 RepID=A0AAW1T7E8_9CHLO
MPQQATAGIQGMLSFITTNKITEGRPVRSKLADSSRSAAGMKWIQPSGPRKFGQGVEDEEQGIISADQTASGGAVLRVTLLAAGFVIGPSGSSVRHIMSQTGAEIKSWTDQARSTSGRPFRVFVVEGHWQCVVAALKIICEAVDRYKELCEGRYCGQHVHRSQIVSAVEFSYQPPPRHLVPYAAALKGQGNRARQGEGREVQAAHAAEVFADVRSALSAQHSLRASAALQQPSTATPAPFSKHAAHCSAAPASARRALYSDATSNAVEQTFAAPLTRQDSFYSFLNPTGQGSSAHTDAPQDPSHYTAEDRWGASGMDPLSTVAHVLAATGHTSPPDTANLFGHSMNTSHAPTLQTPGPHVTGSTSLFGPPSGAAATAAAIRPGTPDPRNRTPFSAYGLDQGDPQDISMSEPPPHHPFPGQTPHLMAAPGASSEGYDLTIAAAASLDSSLGSGFIPAYFDTQGTGMPDLPAGSGLDMRNGRFLTSNGFFSARSSQRSAISRDSSFEHGRGEQPDMGDACDTDMGMGLSSSPSGDGRAPQQGDAYPVGGQASNQQVGMGFRGAEPTGRPYSPALDVDMLRSMGYVPQDVMDDGGYSLGKVSGARRARTMAEGPKPRQGRLPPSPRSIMDQRFSSGTEEWLNQAGAPTMARNDDPRQGLPGASKPLGDNSTSSHMASLAFSTSLGGTGFIPTPGFQT